MRSRVWRRSVVAAALVAVVVSVSGAQEAPTDPSTRRRRLAARVARLKEGGDGPTARSPTGTRPLTAEAEVAPGEVVTAGDGPVELLFPTDEAAAQDRTVDAGERLVLGPGAKATVAPLDTTVDVRLESGQALALSTGELRVQAGGSVVVVRSGDAAIDVEQKAGGAVDVRVDVLAGRVDIEGGGVTRGAAPGERVDLDARGTRVRKVTPKPPKFVETLDAVAPQAVRLFERFATWPLPYKDPKEPTRKPYGEAHPIGASPARGGSDAAFEPEDPAAGAAAEIHFGFGGSDGGPGLVSVTAATRLRIRYRLSERVRLQVRVRKPGAPVPFGSAELVGRAGVWTDLECRPARFLPVAGDDRTTPFGEGRVSYFSVGVGVLPDDRGARVELQHVLFYE